MFAINAIIELNIADTVSSLLHNKYGNCYNVFSA